MALIRSFDQAEHRWRDKVRENSPNNIEARPDFSCLDQRSHQ